MMSESFNQPVAYVPRLSKQSDQKFCHACGDILHMSAPSCTRCGALQPGNAMVRSAGMDRLPGNHVFCRGCGQPIHQTAPHCPHCGAPQPAAFSDTFESPKNRVAAAVLALVLGGLGAHKFYLGDIGLGILYLLFSWTFIPAFIGLIEGLVDLFMSDARFRQKYG